MGPQMAQMRKKIALGPQISQISQIHTEKLGPWPTWGRRFLRMGFMGGANAAPFLGSDLGASHDLRQSRRPPTAGPYSLGRRQIPSDACVGRGRQSVQSVESVDSGFDLARIRLSLVENQVHCFEGDKTLALPHQFPRGFRLHQIQHPVVLAEGFHARVVVLGQIRQRH